MRRLKRRRSNPGTRSDALRAGVHASPPRLASATRRPASRFHQFLGGRASAGPVSWRSCCLRARPQACRPRLSCGPLGVFFAGVAFLPALALAGAAGARLGARVAFLLGFGWAPAAMAGAVPVSSGTGWPGLQVKSEGSAWPQTPAKAGADPAPTKRLNASGAQLGFRNWYADRYPEFIRRGFAEDSRPSVAPVEGR